MPNTDTEGVEQGAVEEEGESSAAASGIAARAAELAAALSSTAIVEEDAPTQDVAHDATGADESPEPVALEAAVAADEPTGDDGDLAPSEDDASAADEAESAVRDAQQAEADRLALAQLQDTMQENGVSSASELLELARELRAGSEKHSKRPAKAAALLGALAACGYSMQGEGSEAANDTATAAAAVELGQMHLLAEGVSRSEAIAIGHFRKAAEFGDPEGQHALAVLHATGFGTPQHQPLATTHYYFAAEGGSVAAQLAVGYRHLLGVHMPKQCQKALLYYNPVAEKVVAGAQRVKAGQLIEKVRLTVDSPRGGSKRGGADDDVIQYYEHSAQKGSVDAQLTLGHLNFHGARGLPVDAERAFAFYSKAGAAGDPTAYSHLGHMYAQGIGVKGDNATALEYFRKGAAKGHPPSQNGLGYMYMHGFGVTQSHKKALEYFKAAAEKGNAEAQFNLGAMHIAGLGVRKAYDKALHYFTLSAHQGHTLALYNLGQMHLNGLGAPRSCPVAVQFLKAVAERGPWGSQLERAHTALQDGELEAPLHLYAALAEGGYEVAQSNVAFLLDQHFMHRPNEPLLGMDAEQVAARAIEMYRRAAQQGNVEAELKLGDYYFYGYGTAVDLEAAVFHYRAAAEARNAQAMFNLAWMYAHGHGLSRDYHLAKRHYDMAAETAAEAAVPVALALCELYLMQMIDAGPSSGAGGRVGGLLGGVLKQVAAAGGAMGGDGLEWDTLLIIALTAVLVCVLIAQRQLVARDH